MGPAPTTSAFGAALVCEPMYAAAWSTPPSMSLTQPQGSSAPATLDITYSRSDGTPELALLGSEPHLQPGIRLLARASTRPVVRPLSGVR